VNDVFGVRCGEDVERIGGDAQRFGRRHGVSAAR
jgi:hypothetical protein